jgi:hypothetical protein
MYGVCGVRMAFHAVSVARETSTGRQGRQAAGSLLGLVRARLVGSDNTANITLHAASLSNLATARAASALLLHHLSPLLFASVMVDATTSAGD